MNRERIQTPWSEIDAICDVPFIPDGREPPPLLPERVVFENDSPAYESRAEIEPATAAAGAMVTPPSPDVRR